MAIHDVLLVVCCLLYTVDVALGHGRLIRPPSRASMWRFGFPTPPNYSDNQLYCGGIGVQYNSYNRGRCGVCGDPFNGAREHEAGGRYANGIIVETYRRGDAIEVDVDITANHLGWISFKLCPHNDVNTPITQDCLDRYVLRINGTYQQTRKYIGSTVGVIRTVVELPPDILCTQCVLQWQYHTGNSWGYTEAGTGCLGCGNQEEFYGCSDIAISETGELYGEGDVVSDPAGRIPEVTEPPITATTTVDRFLDDEDSTVDNSVEESVEDSVEDNSNSNDASSGFVYQCRGVGSWAVNNDMAAWCETNCERGYCPATHCVCEVVTTPDVPADRPFTRPSQGILTCRGIGEYAGRFGMNKWCTLNCNGDYCPVDMCECDWDDSHTVLNDRPVTMSPATARQGSLSSSPSYSGSNQNEDGDEQECVATGAWTGQAAMNEWCAQNCAVSNCPPTHCKCTIHLYTPYDDEPAYETTPTFPSIGSSARIGRTSRSTITPASTILSSIITSALMNAGGDEVCRATGPWEGQQAMDDWCVTNCAVNNCSPTHCICEAPQDQPPAPAPSSCARYTAKHSLQGIEFADDYCHLSCSVGDCPAELCECSHNDVYYLHCYAVNALLRQQPGMNAYCQIVCTKESCPPECSCDL